LGEGHSIARTAGALVSQWVSEIKPVDISQVVLVWNDVLWDIVGLSVVVVPLLDRGEGLSECLSSLLSKLKAFATLIRLKLELVIELCEVLCFLLRLAVGPVVLMALREFADISFPAKVLTVDEGDGFVRLLVRLMLFVCVEPGRGRSVGGLHFGGIFLATLLLGLVGSHFFLILVAILSLDLGLLDGLGGNLVLGSDHGDLDGIRLRLD